MAEIKNPAQTQRLEIELGEAEEHYANITLINQSSNEFILDFARMMPGRPKAQVHARVIMTPSNVKAFLKGLEQHVSRYEEMHGKLPEPKQAQQGFGPGSEGRA